MVDVRAGHAHATMPTVIDTRRLARYPVTQPMDWLHIVVAVTVTPSFLFIVFPQLYVSSVSCG